MEKRRHARFDLQFPISFAGESTEGRGEILNLSMGGCAVGSEAAISTGTYLRVELYLPGDPDPVSIDLAPVRWTSFRQFGLEFIRMSDDARQRLRYFVSGL